LRLCNRTGLGGGPARRVNQAPESESEEADANAESVADDMTAEQYNGGGGGEGGGMLSSSELPPINEQEGRLSGEGAGNTSTASNGSNDSVDRSHSEDGARPSSWAEDGARPRADETTKLVSQQTTKLVPQVVKKRRGKKMLFSVVMLFGKCTSIFTISYHNIVI
jgi:hypothetical protein